jgi:hypothetical protein
MWCCRLHGSARRVEKECPSHPSLWIESTACERDSGHQAWTQQQPPINLASGGSGNDIKWSSWDDSTLGSVVIVCKTIIDFFLIHVVCEDKCLAIVGIIAITIIIAITVIIAMAIIVFKTKSNARLQWHICLLVIIIVVVVVLIVGR